MRELVIGLAVLLIPIGFATRTAASDADVGQTRTTILSLLKKGEAVGSFECVRTESITPERPDSPKQAPGPMRVWQKKGYARTEFAQPSGAATTAVIKRPDGLYIPSESPGTYYLFPLRRSAKTVELYRVENLLADQLVGFEKKWSSLLDSPHLAIVVTEVLGGHEATLMEYVVPDWVPGVETRIKLWLSNETGLPLAREQVMVNLPNTTLYSWTTKWQNYVFEDIPDSMFAVPKGSIQKLSPDSWASFWTS